MKLSELFIIFLLVSLPGIYYDFINFPLLIRNTDFRAAVSIFGLIIILLPVLLLLFGVFVRITEGPEEIKKILIKNIIILDLILSVVFFVFSMTI